VTRRRTCPPRAVYRALRPSRRFDTSPASNSLPRCCDTAGRGAPTSSARLVTSYSPSRTSHISRSRVGSASIRSATTAVSTCSAGGRGWGRSWCPPLATVTASAVVAAYEAIDRLLHPREVTGLWAVALAAVVGFLGNEWIARYRIRTGRKIGSAALVADGLHARTDGFTSMAVLLGAGGVALGWPLADPVIGLGITAAILVVVMDAAKQVYRRLMDSVDPALVDAAETALLGVAGVRGVGQVRMRWIGHSLRAEADIIVNPQLTVTAAHALAVQAEHALVHAVPRLTAATIHTDHTVDEHDSDPHAVLAHTTS